MPSLETPPNPAPTPATPPPESPQQPVPLRVQTRRFGELEEHELIHLLDSLDDERSRSRFRESIYISVLFYVIVAWFVLYGPRVLWHSPQIVAVEPKHDSKELTYLETPRDLSKLIPKPSKVISDKSAVAQTAHPTPDKKTLEQLQAMRRAGEPAPRPTPAPPSPQPQQQAPQQQPQQQQPRPAPPVVQHPQPSAIPDAPRPSQSTRPYFGGQMSPGQSIAEAARNAARGGGGDYGANAPVGHPGANTGAEILSDTMGVDFGPYIQRLLRMVRAAWIPLIPEECNPPISKEGSTLIRFTIQPDGTLSFMGLDASTHDRAIDEAAWGGIKGVGQFPPLPANFKGKDLQLRIQFNIVQNHRGAQ